MTVTETPLAAPLNVGFDYTRSTGPVLGRFVNALRERRIEGIRGSDGRVLVPPVEYDPVTAEEISDFVEVAEDGPSSPGPGAPRRRPAAQPALRLGARAPRRRRHLPAPRRGRGEAGEHAQRDARPDAVGARTRGPIPDIACFRPEERRHHADRTRPRRHRGEGDPVSVIITPARLKYTALRRAREPLHARPRRGQAHRPALPLVQKVYIPPRGACPTCGVPPRRGRAARHRHRHDVLHRQHPVPGPAIKLPYVYAHILLDGADIAFLHLVRGMHGQEVRMGMRVEAGVEPARRAEADAREHRLLRPDRRARRGLRHLQGAPVRA